MYMFLSNDYITFLCMIHTSMRNNSRPNRDTWVDQLFDLIILTLCICKYIAYICTYIYILYVGDVIITTPPENTTVCRGSDVTISCGHVTAIALLVTWIINGTSFNLQELANSPLYQQNRQAIPTENSLTVFSINGTTTFQCIVLSTPNTISTLGTVTVTGKYVRVVITCA